MKEGERWREKTTRTFPAFENENPKVWKRYWKRKKEIKKELSFCCYIGNESDRMKSVASLRVLVTLPATRKRRRERNKHKEMKDRKR